MATKAECDSTLRRYSVRCLQSAGGFDILRFACRKMDKAQRHQYWTFDVEFRCLQSAGGFDVPYFCCSGRAKFYMSVAAGRERPVTSKKKLPLMHSAIIDCGSGFQPRFTRSGIYIINVVSYEGSGYSAGLNL